MFDIGPLTTANLTDQIYRVLRGLGLDPRDYRQS